MFEMVLWVSLEGECWLLLVLQVTSSRDRNMYFQKHWVQERVPNTQTLKM